MKFDIYCDESRPDVIHSRSPNGSKLVIGSLWLPTEKRAELKRRIHALRNIHKIGGEFKWSKLSNSKTLFYQALIDLFFELEDDLRFRCISVNRERVDLIKYHDGDQELGFYKFYYQLLHHWILDFNDYHIFCDHKMNRDRTRLHVLRRCLNYANLSSQISTVQAVKSEESVLLQMADVVTSAAAARLNNSLGHGTAKTHLVEKIEGKLGHVIAPTHRNEQKFNVFEIQPGGGW